MAQLSDETLITRLAWRVQAYPSATAFLQKRHGIWQSWSWDSFAQRVNAVSVNLHAAGLQGGDAVGILCGLRMESAIAVLACQRAGMIPVLLNPNLAAGGFATLAQRAGIAALVAEDQEQVDKFADVQTRLPMVRHCWVVDPKGTRAYKHVNATPFIDLEMAVKVEAVSLPITTAESPAVGLFSAGVYKESRFVTVSHAALLRHQHAAYPLGLNSGEKVASLFGLADPIGLFLTVVAPILFGTVPCFGEGRTPTAGELRQCAPAVLALPARIIDQMRRETSARAARTGGIQQKLIQRWIAKTQARGWQDMFVGRPIAASLGMGATHTVMTGYERMTPISARFLARLGISTRGLYCLAEAGGPIAAFAQAEAPVLHLFEGYSAEVATDGCLSIRLGNQMLDTGDIVDLSDGEVHIVGRQVEMLTMPDGSTTSPAIIEAELQVSPYISQAVAVGGPGLGVAALVELDELTLRDWARSHNLSFTTGRSLAESSEVARLIEQAVSEANQRLPSSMRIQRFVLLPRPLDASNGELTPALALRRSIVRNRYAHRLIQGVTA